MKLPPLPELPFLPETQDQRDALVWWAMEYGKSVQEECAKVERSELPVQWCGDDGTHHEISLDYAAAIAKWMFDKCGDVDAVDALIASAIRSTE